MDALQKKLQNKTSGETFLKPSFFHLSKKADQRSLLKLIHSGRVHSVIDDYKEQQQELFAIKNPTKVYGPNFQKLFDAYWKSLGEKLPIVYHGVWVYFPWLSSVVHILPDTDFQAVRTARNRNLITAEEQKKFYDAVVGVGGLSVGSSAALAIVLQGGARRIRLADHDRLALSNTNRIRAGVQNLGLYKVEVTAREIYEINPYAEIEIFPEGLTQKNLNRFFSGLPKLDVMIDAIDNLSIKYLIREQARKYRVPVIMGADNGDNAVLDVERYDLNPKTKFFHGRMGNVTYEKLAHLDKFGIGKMITMHVGVENVTERMKGSLLEMGKTIVSWPQLGGAAMINGAALAYCVRKIVNGQPLEKNRSLIGLDEKLIPTYHSVSEKKKRLRSAQEFRKIFGL